MSHYYTANSDTKSSEFEIAVHHKKDSFRMISDHGVFSKDKLDLGSKLLIEKAQINKNDKVLDLGCGNGIIGVSIARLVSVDLFLSDVNERAISLANQNLRKLKIKGKVINSNIFENIDDEFDVILTNPPYAAGREVCFKIIIESKDKLKKGGSLQLVARHNKGGKVLGEKIMEVFGNLNILGRGSGFRVYQGVKE
jgi:16S rRNA (guanine1207-N2)-methyltransferase